MTTDPATPPTAPGPSSPDQVRLALPAEAASISAIQRRGWEQLLPPAVAREALAGVDLATMSSSWESAILRPPLAKFRVLVAVGGSRVVGFAAVGPADEPDTHPGDDALVGEFVIDPRAQRAGHGSRLLNAIADTLRADGFSTAYWWVRSADDPLRAFLASAGWGPDGAYQTVNSPDGTPLKMLRYHTAL